MARPKCRAADYYRHALEGDYAQALWHLKLALCLEKTGSPKGAYDEAMVALRFQKGLLEAEQVLDRNRDYIGTPPPAPTTAPTPTTAANK